MVRSTLPQNYESKFLVLDTFNDISSWTVGSGAKSSDAYGMNVIPTNPAGTVTMDKNISVDVSDYQCVELVLFCHDASPVLSVSSIWIYLMSSAGFTQIFSGSIQSAALAYGFNTVRVNPFASGPDTGNPTKLITHVRISMNSRATYRPNVSFVSFSMGGGYSPSCQLQFDDGMSAVYDTIYPYLSARGLRATVHIIPNQIGHTGYMTLAQLDEIYEAGWDLTNHTMNHHHLPTLTLAEQRSEISDAYDFLLDQGFLRAAKHVAYPYGEYNADTLTVMTELGMDTGRSTNGSSTGTFALPVSKYLNVNTKYQLPAYMGVVLSTMLTIFKSNVKTGGSFILYNHDGDAEDGKTIAVLKSFWDYVASSKIRCLTASEWYDGLTNPRYKSIPATRTLAASPRTVRA